MLDLSLIRQQNLSRSGIIPGSKGTYHVHTWGCQMNEEDSEQIALSLERSGYAKAGSIHEADVVLLNTCSVRKKPEDKAFSMLGELVPVKKARPHMILAVRRLLAPDPGEQDQRPRAPGDFGLGTGQDHGNFRPV